MNIFETLNQINVNDKTEKKNGLTYLSWAWAWGEVKKAFPDATFTIYERETQFGPVNYFTDGRTCWVKTGLTINGLEHIEELPVMDFRNNSISLDKVNSTDVNKAIQRSLTKAAARHGLGLYIYAGEDLPECEQVEKEPPKPAGEPFTPPKAGKANVNATDKLPVNPVANYISNEITDIQEIAGIKTYAEAKKQVLDMVKTMAESGMLEPVDWMTITLDQAKNVFAAVRKMLPGDVA